MRALHLAILCAALFVLGIFAGGCGSSDRVARNGDDTTTTTVTTSGESSTDGCDEVGGCGTYTKPDDDGDPETRGFEGCAEAGGCEAYMYVLPDGQTFFCTDLRIILIEAPIRAAPQQLAPPLRLRSVTVPLTVPGIQTVVTTPTTTTERQLVGRPTCAKGSKVIQVVGADLTTIELQKSEDGKTSWTPMKVRLSGRIENGKLVVGG